jgi:hypothetical protein
MIDFRSIEKSWIASVLRGAWGAQLDQSARATVTRLYSWQRAASQIEQIYAQVARPARFPTGLRQLRAMYVAGIDSLRQRSYKRCGLYLAV